MGLNLVRPDAAFWRGKRVLITGHTGFKGAWLAIWLARMGAHVTGVALPPATSPNLYGLAGVERVIAASHFLDIRDAECLTQLIQAAEPDVLLHLAAQALVRSSYASPVETFATNLMGTVHVLEAIRNSHATRVAVMVTTDKVYLNREWARPYREDDTLGGHDPYSASKATCEIAIASYRSAFLHAQGVRIASARAGNVVGGGDWSADRLLPDAMRAWQAGHTLDIRRPNAVRPWQHVLEPLSAYLLLAQALWQGRAPEEAYNFGPNPQDAASVRRLIELAQQSWGGGAKVSWGDGTEGPHEAGLLSLDTARAQRVLGLVPHWGLEETVTRTVNWYRSAIAGSNALALCHANIDAFEACA